jgi:hypothetical protein
LQASPDNQTAIVLLFFIGNCRQRFTDVDAKPSYIPLKTMHHPILTYTRIYSVLQVESKKFSLISLGISQHDNDVFVMLSSIGNEATGF